MTSKRIQVQSMEDPDTNDPTEDSVGGGGGGPTETVHNLYYDSDEDEDEGVDEEDEGVEEEGGSTERNEEPLSRHTDIPDTPVSQHVEDDVVLAITDDDDDDIEELKSDEFVGNKELFQNMPSMADTARSLATASSVKNTMRRRMSKKVLSTSIRAASGAGRGGETSGGEPSSSTTVQDVQRRKDVEDGEKEIIRSLGAPMGERRSIRRLNLEQRKSTKERHKLPCWKLFKLKMAMSWKLFKDKTTEFFLSLQLWRSPLKEVEGNFGNGVLSYFLFLRSLFVLNIVIFLIELFLVIPQALINNHWLKDFEPLLNVTEPVIREDYVTNRTAADLLLDFFTGQGWINTTIMFYSNYYGKIVVNTNYIHGHKDHEDTLVYNMPLAYIMVGGAYMVASFLIMVRNFSTRFTESIMESTDAFQSYCNKVFASWDYCITNDKAAVLKKNIIYQDFIADLAEERRLENIKNRTRIDKFKIYMTRLVINILVLALLAGSVYAIFYTVSELATQEVSIEKAINMNNFVAILTRWSSSLVISGLNLILPTLFEILTNLEQWNPHLTLVMSLFRSVLLKLASLIVLMVTMYEKYKNHTCDQCWENQIAAQMFNLILVDFFVVCLVTIFVETGRKYASIYLKCGSLNLGEKIGRPEFQIPKNILDLVYGQSLIWLGTFFAPLLPVLGIVKLIIIFYVKKVSLMFNCKSSSKSFQGARSNYFITLLLLLTFLLCTVGIGYGVSQVRTSRWGPYSNNRNCTLDKKMIGVIGTTIDTFPPWAKGIFGFIKTPVFVIPVLIIVFLLLYYYHAMTTAHEKMIELLQGQLKIEGRDKRFLMNRLVEINNNVHKEN